MDNFKKFQLSTEEAMNVTGQGFVKKLLEGYSKEDRKTIKTSIANLKASEGFEELTKKERRAKIIGAVELFDQGIIIVNGPFVN